MITEQHYDFLKKERFTKHYVQDKSTFWFERTYKKSVGNIVISVDENGIYTDMYAGPLQSKESIYKKHKHKSLAYLKTLVESVRNLPPAR
jgi:hypothetical protein